MNDIQPLISIIVPIYSKRLIFRLNTGT